MSTLRKMQDELAVVERTREVTSQKADGLERRAARDMATVEELNGSVTAMTVEIKALRKEIAVLEKEEPLAA